MASLVLFVVGPQGCGKTKIADGMAERLRGPVHIVHESDPAELARAAQQFDTIVCTTNDIDAFVAWMSDAAERGTQVHVLYAEQAGAILAKPKRGKR